MLKHYYALIKPGIIYGNAITLIGGFLLASNGAINVRLLGLTLVGLSLVIASGCVFNNYIDRDVDAKMERTKNRELVKGEVSKKATMMYGVSLGILGFATLFVFANIFAIAAAALGFFFYVFMYSMWFKRRSVWGTVIGSISGATPPVVGYCAAANRFDAGAVILFLILVFWQMPHFYAIAMYRLKDYAAAGIPVLPVKKGSFATKVQMLAYIVAFAVAATLLAHLGYASQGYFVTATLLSLAWLFLAVQGFGVKDDARWARTMFFFSLIVLMVLFIAISADGIVRAL